MFWRHPDNKVGLVSRYYISDKSPLNVPPSILVSPKNFEEKLKAYWNGHVDDDSVKLLMAMADVYKTFIRDNGIEIISSQNNAIKKRHENEVIEFIKIHVPSIEQILNYLY